MHFLESESQIAPPIQIAPLSQDSPAWRRFICSWFTKFEDVVELKYQLYYDNLLCSFRFLLFFHLDTYRIRICTQTHFGTHLRGHSRIRSGSFFCQMMVVLLFEAPQASNMKFIVFNKFIRSLQFGYSALGLTFVSSGI